MNFSFFSDLHPGRKLRAGFELIKNIFSNEKDSIRQKHAEAFSAFAAKLMYRDGKIDGQKREIFISVCENYFTQEEIREQLDDLASVKPLPDEQISAGLSDLGVEEKQQTLSFLMVFVIALGDKPEDVNEVLDLGISLGCGKTEMEKMHEDLIEPERRRRHIVGAGWGIAVALGVIVIFILIAKILPSIIYGLILAALLLPLTVHCAKKIRKKSGLSYLLVLFFNIFSYPLRKASKSLRKHLPEKRPVSKDKNSPIIYQSIGVSLFYALILATLFVFLLFFSFTGMFESIRSKVNLNQSISFKTPRLDSAVQKIQKFPPIKKIQFKLKDSASREVIIANLEQHLLSHSGGILQVIGRIFGKVVGIFSNLLLTIFFAAIFLLKFAQFQLNAKVKSQKLSEHLVNNIFNGVWLPKVAPEISKEAGIIIEGLLFRLRLWLKGYFTLVLIDSTVYATVFFFLGVPVPLLLGVCSGCGILLPYLGPVIACFITLLASTVLGDISASMLLVIVICYLIYNGIIEQFILYPAVIGDALGLNSLETIAIVLLGAVFAGIPGMIFALPAASAAKYLIPMIYKLKVVSKFTAPSA